jgi:hypothetical protein
MASRSDNLSEARQNGAGDHEHTSRAMSRHVMWHELRAVREENRATLSGGPRRFIRQTTVGVHIAYARQLREQAQRTRHITQLLKPTFKESG